MEEFTQEDINFMAEIMEEWFHEWQNQIKKDLD